MKYIVYKTTNTINGKYYIGKHKTYKDWDGYLGSGIAMKNAIKKYGKGNFIRETLAEFESDAEASDYEAVMVNEAVVRDENSYNETVGGSGGFYHINSNPNRINPMHVPEYVEKLKTSLKKSLARSTAHKESSRKNIRIAIQNNIGRKRPEHAKKVSVTSKKHWEDHREEMRDALSHWYEVTAPDGTVYETNRLSEFSEEHGLPSKALYSTIKSGKPKTKGVAKGWKAKIIVK